VLLEEQVLLSEEGTDNTRERKRKAAREPAVTKGSRALGFA